MNYKKLKIIFWTLGIALVLIGVVVAAIGFKYYSLTKKDIDIETVQEPQFQSAEKVPLGEVLDATTIFKCPWNRMPESAELVSGKGSQNVGEPQISRLKIGWGYCLWKVVAKTQPYTVGKIDAGKLMVHFNASNVKGGNGKNITLNVPAFSVAALDTGKSNELAVADQLGKLDTVKKSWNWLIGGLIILGLLAIILWKFRRKRMAPKIVLPPWAIALREIRELSESLGKGLISTEVCVSKLTDVVRCYLEKKFRLHAQTQTTIEFLGELEKPASPLSEGHRSFLKEFLTAADLVKFAGFPADNSLVDNAIDKANRLVEETSEKKEKSDEHPENKNGISRKMASATV